MNPVLPQSSQQDELYNILFRRQQLQNRLQFLKEIQKKNNRIDGKNAYVGFMKNCTFRK